MLLLPYGWGNSAAASEKCRRLVEGEAAGCGSECTAMAATQPPTTSYGEGKAQETMDPSLWGALQSYIDLPMIYAKLPMADFFRLRQVCKEWNRLAADRKFLEQHLKSPVSSPYFVVANRRTGHRLLTYDSSARRWSWTRLPPVTCEVAGLLFEDSDRHRVFDVHTRVFHALPPFPAVPPVPLLPAEEEEDYEDPLVGMTVDTSVKPYSFRVILADEVIGTRIYDSKSGEWTHKPSTYEYAAPVEGTQSCAHYDGFLYLRVWGPYGAAFDLHTYDFERDEWDCQVPGMPEDLWEFCDVGVWRDRLFVFGMKFGTLLTAWELLNHFEEPWALFDCMPGELCSWIIGEEYRYDNIQSKFCGEYVLVYNCVGLDDVTERAVLFNLDRKTWEKVELPQAAAPCRGRDL